MDNKIGYTYQPNGINDLSRDLNLPQQVYNLSGQPCSADMEHLPKGIYILRQGRQSRKIQVR
jgi:hypothetical protein